MQDVTMFILNPYDRYLHKSINSSAPPSRPLIDNSSNSPLCRLVLSPNLSRKASPVVSVTTALAGDNNPCSHQLTHNYIPFPSISAPIPISSERRHSQQHDENTLCIETVHKSVSSDWLLDMQQRKRSQSCLSNSRVHPDSSRLPIGKITLDYWKHGQRERSGTKPLPPFNKDNGLKKILEGTQYRKACRKERGGAERRKSRKVGKHVISDAKFLAVLHMTITWHIGRVEESVGEISTGDDSRTFDRMLTVQDKLLAQKLWNHLVERGHYPHKLLKPPRLSPPTSCSSDVIVPSPNSVAEDSCSATSPLVSPIPYSESGSSAVSPPGVLSISQAVASLILKRKDRTFSPRPRALNSLPTSCYGGIGRKSPLSKMCTLEDQTL